MEYSSANKKNEVLSFATTWMDQEDIMLNEIVRERQLPYDFTHTWTLRNKRTKAKRHR